MKKRKVKETTKGFNPNNCLGWTEDEYILMICQMCLVKMRNDIRLTEQETKVWINWSDDFMSGRLEKRLTANAS